MLELTPPPNLSLATLQLTKTESHHHNEGEMVYNEKYTQPIPGCLTFCNSVAGLTALGLPRIYIRQL